VGLLGAVHLVADQDPPEHPFNAARVPRIFLKYFIPYLAAILQRHTLHRVVHEASALVRTAPQHLATGLAALRTHLLAFALGGYFTQVSTREVLHRYYRLCQEGLDVPYALTAARQALADLDAQFTTTRQVDLAENMQQLQTSMTRHLHTVAHVQVMVEWIEIFLVSVYAAHLWHMIEPHIYWDWLHTTGWGMPYGTWGVLLIALVAGLLTALVLRPWRLHEPHAGDIPDVPRRPH
jgi:hypothetical protein